MFCSACGHAVTPGQPACPRCGRPMAAVPSPATPPLIPGWEFQLSVYAGKLRSLSVVWFIYGALSTVLGVLALSFANAIFEQRFRWTQGPIPPLWFGPAFIHFAWLFLLMRVALALVAGWGLMHREPWGRIVAIVAAFVNILKFPLGTALAIWTLVVLMGYRNATLYDQIAEG